MKKRKKPHEHEHQSHARGGLIFAIVANSIFMAVEVVFGLIAGSLALPGDAGHNFADSLALPPSLIAVLSPVWIAREVQGPNRRARRGGRFHRIRPGLIEGG